MAEFCVSCFEKMNELKPRAAWTYQLDFDLCEGCGEWRADIVSGLHAGAVTQIIQYFKLKKDDKSALDATRFSGTTKTSS